MTEKRNKSVLQQVKDFGPVRDVRALDKWLLQIAKEADELKDQVKRLLAGDQGSDAVEKIINARRTVASLGSHLLSAQTEAFRIGGKR